MKFLEDLKVDVMDSTSLIIMWKLKVKVQYKITKEEFVEGFRGYNLTNLQQIIDELPKWKSEIKEKKPFKQFYNYVFTYSKPPTQKTVGIIIISYW